MVIVTEARAISSFSLLVTIIIGFFRLFPPPKPIKTGGKPFFFLIRGWENGWELSNEGNRV